MEDLIRTNEQLREQLTVEARLRREAEQRVQELLAKPPASAAESAAEALLREELSLALEELQVMQEELQLAHDALGAEQRTIQ